MGTLEGSGGPNGGAHGGPGLWTLIMCKVTQKPLVIRVYGVRVAESWGSGPPKRPPAGSGRIGGKKPPNLGRCVGPRMCQGLNRPTKADFQILTSRSAAGKARGSGVPEAPPYARAPALPGARAPRAPEAGGQRPEAKRPCAGRFGSRGSLAPVTQTVYSWSGLHRLCTHDRRYTDCVLSAPAPEGPTDV